MGTDAQRLSDAISELLLTLWAASLLILPLLALWLALALRCDAARGHPTARVRWIVLAALMLLTLQVLLFRAPQLLPGLFFALRGPEITFFALPLWIGVEAWGAALATGWRRRWLYAAIFGSLSFLGGVLALGYVLR
ncbi:hypothetical protein N0B44_23395 [Roseibacterium beibuensis]|uniref:Uncharacterized protein n=1 Tax=[Roseibacterium] beibuensis TaxID=1193142 RepID=A0ABP9LI40_9RHOB|nr:hypothetical protein [Roseibacterium beibuensis]MCS6625865.1 hypothetical protein [Roseibacterium beibuensis]